ncbi:tail assembly protein [Shewanella insulae]|uniref:tail assembly protein n=1 Tax=Shewanella insulae TaxID=2681496 RepID=UPI001EFE603F|nr:tail assembly protein [Shewanella insulae]MCG9740173.1 tail assembly protein [Shewanella insulae]
MPEQQKVVIKLSGSLAAKFGRCHVRYLESGKTWEAFSALKHTLQGFEQFVVEQAKLGMRYAIFRNGENVSEDEFDFEGTREIRIVPIMEGSKRNGVLQTIVGAVLIVVGVVINYFTGAVGNIFIQAGIGMMAGGIVQMLSPQNLSTSSNEDSSTSYAFGGAVNTSAQGNPVGIGYGERLVGGAIISAGIYAEDQR